MKQVKIVYASLLQLQVGIKFLQGLAAVGFKIPEGVVEIEKEMAVIFHALR
jgi:hypothetical protein